MMTSDIKSRIRAIFLHEGEPVSPDTAAEWLGWSLESMDAAIKWGAVKLDELDRTTPRITFAELLRHATDQWAFSEIRQALGEDADAIFHERQASASAEAIIDDVLAYVLQQGYRRDAAAADSARADARSARRRGRGLDSVSRVASPPPARRLRDDGVREFTLTRIEVASRGFVPYLRLRGRWLARLGFKPGMRVYVDSTPGQLTISVCDPARLNRSASRVPDVAVPNELSAACAAVRAAAAPRRHDTPAFFG